MVVSHNLSAMFTSNQLNINQKSQSKSAERLASGFRVNRAADDAAGLSISEKMRWQVRGLNRASQNIQDGVSLVQLTDGALNEAEEVLQRIRELSVQAANDTNTFEDRAAIQKEINENIKEVNRIAESTSFNGIFPLRANDEFALDPTVSENTTPTKVEEGVYNMNQPVNIDIDGNGTLEAHSGMNIDFANTTPDDLDKKNFFVTCSQACNQIFSFSFNKDLSVDNSSCITKNQDGSTSLFLTIGTNGMTSGSEIPAKIVSNLGSSEPPVQCLRATLPV